MGLLSIFSKPAKPLLQLHSGSFSIDRTGRVLATTLPSSFPRDLVEEIALPQFHLLPMPRERIEELRLERRARPARVEIRQERILGIVENHGGIEPRAEAIGQTRFPQSHRSFNREIPKVHGGASIPAADRETRALR